MSAVFELLRGDSPLVVSMPHVGLVLPTGFNERLTSEAQALPDTDWWVDRLYNFLPELGVSVLKANYSRYLIDLNRRADGVSLYPGQSVTEICPTTTFAGTPLYRAGKELREAEIPERVQSYWQPYHEALQTELGRIKARFGYALLWDAHSIRSEVPRFFSGKLPDLNFGTGDGSSCDPALTQTLQEIAKSSKEYGHVINGRFKGGAITRLYGWPTQGQHAVQLELSQATYMDENPPYRFRDDLAEGVRPLLRQLVQGVLDWQPWVRKA